MTARINGALISYVVIVVNVIVTLLFTPFLVSSLGQAGYGLVSLSIAFLAYLNMLDFGLNDSLLRFFVQYRDKPALTNHFLAQMLSLYVAIGLIILLVGYALQAIFPLIFSDGLRPQEIVELQAMLIVMMVGAAVLIGSNPIGALAYAHERFVFMKGLDLVTMLASTGVIVLLLLKGHGPFAVAAVMAAGKVFQAVVRTIYVHRTIGVRLALAFPGRDDLERVMRYAAPIFVSIIAVTIFWKFDSILIGAVLGAAPIAIYAIGVTFNKYFMSFATALSRIMTPDIVRRIDAGADALTLTRLMVRISRVQALVLLVVLGGLIVFGQRFLTLWLGPDFSLSYWVMIAVLVPYALELTGNARNIVLQVKGLYWYKSAITLTMAVLNIPLTLYFLDIWGVVGAAASTGLAIMADYLLIALLLQRRVGIEMGHYWRETGRGIVPVFVIMIAVGLVTEPFLPVGWEGLALGASLFTLCYAGAMLGFAVNDQERHLFGQVFGRIIPRRCRPT